MTSLERAIKDGYAHIIGEAGKQKITYVSSDNHVENYNDPEERVRAEFWAELIYKYEYPVNRIKIEVTVPDRLPTDRADIVVFRDDECKRPYGRSFGILRCGLPVCGCLSLPFVGHLERNEKIRFFKAKDKIGRHEKVLDNCRILTIKCRKKAKKAYIFTPFSHRITRQEPRQV